MASSSCCGGLRWFTLACFGLFLPLGAALVLTGAGGCDTETSYLKEITDKNFEDEVLKAKQPVLVDFWAAWCGPCRQLAPTIEALAKDYAGRVKVGKVDVDKQQKTAQNYGIQAIPTVILFKDGKDVERIVGFDSPQKYKAMLEKHAAPAPPAGPAGGK